MSHVHRCLVLVMLLLAASYAASAQSATDPSSGTRVAFPLTPFDDTLFTGVDGAYRARFDDDGHVWYTTEGGVMRIDPANATRELYTKLEGLPSSYALGIAVAGDQVFVGTDLGLAVIDRETGIATALPAPSTAPYSVDDVVQELAVVGDELWVGTRFFGVGIWNMTRPVEEPGAWTFKNTSTSTRYAAAVRRIVATDDAVWVATAGDGAWRYDRFSGAWTPTVRTDGLPQRDSDVLGVAERAGAVWFALPNGLAVRDAEGAWKLFTTADGLPADRVTDVDVIPTGAGTLDVFASTSRGLWQLDPSTGDNVTRSQAFGILGSRMFDSEYEGAKGWLFSTTRGVSLRVGESWRYFSTGPTDGPTWGPVSYGFTSASVGEHDGYLWFGAQAGISAYKLPTEDVRATWQNFGEWQNFPGSVVNWIDVDGNVTWFATNHGAFGFEHETGRWIPKMTINSRNLVYGLEADRGELWIALFGDGLIMENLTTGVTRAWDHKSLVSPLPDQYLTDVRADGDTMWVGASVGLIRIDRASGAIRSTYTEADGIPGNGVVFRLLPEGANVWIATQDGGVARFDVASGRVGRVWNATNTPGFPDAEVRALHREGGRLWVGTAEGLVMIDVASGRARVWNQTADALVQNFVNGISSAEGTLYLATLSGVQRMDVETLTFLPMRDGPGVIRGAIEGGAGAATRVSVRIDSPRDGAGVVGVTQVRGSAIAFGEAVQRVEVRVGEGEWQLAQGAEAWSFEWDASGLPPNELVTLGVRAFAGNLTGSREIVVTPIAPPTIPLRIEEVPPGDAYANRSLAIAARVEGDEPLSASVYYKPPGASNFQRLPLTRQGGLFIASIPARDMREGDMRYYLESQSGLLIETAAGDANQPTILAVAPAPRLAVAVEGPFLVEAKAGEETRFRLNITNTGTEPARFRLDASGLRAAWVSVPPEDIELAPGETRPVTTRLNVPVGAFADNTTLAFVARDSRGLAEPATAGVPLRIFASDSAAPTVTPSGPQSWIPLPPIVALAAIGLALLLRRRPT